MLSIDRLVSATNAFFLILATTTFASSFSLCVTFFVFFSLLGLASGTPRFFSPSLCYLTRDPSPLDCGCAVATSPSSNAVSPSRARCYRVRSFLRVSFIGDAGFRFFSCPALGRDSVEVLCDGHGQESPGGYSVFLRYRLKWSCSFCLSGCFLLSGCLRLFLSPDPIAAFLSILFFGFLTSVGRQ